MAERPGTRGPVGDRVAENIRRERTGQHLTLSDVAHACAKAGHPMHISTLSKIEKSERRVSVDDLVALAWVLNISPNDLLFGDGTRSRTVALSATTRISRDRLRRWLSTEPPSAGSPASTLTDLVRGIVDEVLADRCPSGSPQSDSD